MSFHGKIFKNYTIISMVFLISSLNFIIFSKAYALDNIEIISIEPVNYTGGNYDTELGLEKLCLAWRLNKQQIKQIFHLSEAYVNTGLPNGFLILPCSIDGKLKVKNKFFDFSINAGSTAIILDNKNISYGCKVNECKSLFIEPYSEIE